MFGFSLEDYCGIFEEGISNTDARTGVSPGEQLPLKGSPPYTMGPGRHPHPPTRPQLALQSGETPHREWRENQPCPARHLVTPSLPSTTVLLLTNSKPLQGKVGNRKVLPGQEGSPVPEPTPPTPLNRGQRVVYRPSHPRPRTVPHTTRIFHLPARLKKQYRAHCVLNQSLFLSRYMAGVKLRPLRGSANPLSSLGSGSC